jgi:3-oxoacyl-[acyl-carrier protein] reductase
MGNASGLSGKRVLVTAASKGIGFGAAEAFLAEGARVVINSSSKENLSAAEKRLRTLGEVHSVVADHTIEADLDRLVDETKKLLGGIDVLVYVAGPPPAGTFMEKGYKDWIAAAELLMVSPAYLGRRVALEMIGSNTKGSMVFVASFTIREPVLNLAASNVARAGVLGLVRSLARELGPKGIRVNGVMPGYIETDRLRKVVDDTAVRRKISREQAMSETVAQIPLGRLGTTKEMAEVILFLAGDRSSYVSGAMVPVDGAYLHSVG